MQCARLSNVPAYALRPMNIPFIVEPWFFPSKAIILVELHRYVKLTTKFGLPLKYNFDSYISYYSCYMNSSINSEEGQVNLLYIEKIKAMNWSIFPSKRAWMATIRQHVFFHLVVSICSRLFLCIFRVFLQSFNVLLYVLIGVFWRQQIYPKSPIL